MRSPLPELPESTGGADGCGDAARGRPVDIGRRGGFLGGPVPPCGGLILCNPHPHSFVRLVAVMTAKMPEWARMQKTPRGRTMRFIQVAR